MKRLFLRGSSPCKAAVEFIEGLDYAELFAHDGDRILQIVLYSIDELETYEEAFNLVYVEKIWNTTEFEIWQVQTEREAIQLAHEVLEKFIKEVGYENLMHLSGDERILGEYEGVA